ncbi:hypothetical protein OG436_29380 [Streptomyces caniferus]|uniref:hypothetical protein n=1 Tax=Streptomyces caniferus TaxID=285557 RepID=UPI002E28154F|nr:hypothetical protein [Streptomyces caniferus]
MADIEAVLCPWVESVTGCFTAPDAPDRMEGDLPVIRIQRLGGYDARFANHPRVVIDVFAGTADEARALGTTVTDALLFLRGPVNGAVVRDTRCDSGFSRQPWANELIHRRGAAFTISLRAA